ncbi:hypothetical protein BGZ73_006060 [Actinomortierella ambigua]|nr:hypothetical protein BGZ73_006060 [Actinomortierella ambigua]
MGWFTRSSDSNKDKDNAEASAGTEPHTTGDASTPQEQVPRPAASAPSHSSKDLPSSEPFSPIPIPDDQPSVLGATAATTSGATGGSEASPAVTVEQRTRKDMYIFDEYKPVDDVMEKYKVGDAMNHLFACSSLGSNIRNYYRFGTFRDCSDKYDHLKFCMSLKTKTDQVAQIMIQKREAQLRAAKAAQPNSEDVWSVRPSPPDDLVDLAQRSP